MAVIIGFTALHLWVQGYFYIMGKDTAPGGKWSITLYSRAMGTGSSNLPWVRGGYSYIVRNADKRRGEYRVTYQKSEYMGHWWGAGGRGKNGNGKPRRRHNMDIDDHMGKE